MNQTLTDLIRISNQTGKDTALVQGGGGNTSAKTPDGKYMYIKASGTALKDMDEKKGWRRMEIARVLEIVADPALVKMEPQSREARVSDLLSLCCDQGQQNARPSVEAHLHAMLDRFVIHLHPIAVGAYVNAKDGRKQLEKVFADEKYPPLWVPYVDPGLMLAKKIQQLVGQYKKEYGKIPSILFLDKHGLFVTASTPEKAVRIVKRVIRLCNKRLTVLDKKKAPKVDAQQVTEIKLALRKAHFKATGQYNNVSFFQSPMINAFLANRNAKKMLSAGALTPDELVYAHGPAMYVDKIDADKIASMLTKQIVSGQKASVTFLVAKVGLFVIANEKTASVIKDVVESSFFIRTNAWKMGGVWALSKRQRDFINNWEAETFRKSLVAGSAEGPLTCRIAVVTGAGSGLGRSIAVGMARAGAQVAIADIDKDAAEQTREMIQAEMPGAGAMVLAANVIDEKSVAEGFEAILERWGGLDILVNAAGVAPAYPLTDTPVDKWSLALQVNLTGYMLMAKYASQWMIEQGMGGAIVNISSKSGIDASKNNGAYNATKAGELHLSRGWAMELGPHNIRVNSVCPGNVFEGSKIWNPQYIRTCAKKYGIKPEEVIPYYVNKTMLKLEIKGQDIADAVVFLSSDQARRVTAQTLVVDSGQAVVR